MSDFLTEGHIYKSDETHMCLLNQKTLSEARSFYSMKQIYEKGEIK